MSAPTLQQQIDAARAYETLMVPALFGPWSPKVADAAQLAPGQRVLDLACGTGILAREAATRTGPDGSVTGLDPAPGMLAVARQLAPGLTWEQGVAEALPFTDRAFDAVISQFGLMFFGDRRAALREALRVLAPRGRLAVAVWAALDRNPAYALEVALLERLAGEDAAAALRAPFALGEQDALATLFASAGAADVAVATRQDRARFPGIRAMVEADLRGWLPLMGVVLEEAQIAAILAEAERALAAFVTADGTVAFDTSAHIVTGSAA